jgi:ATP:ADP antiporter, AAA family
LRRETAPGFVYFFLRPSRETLLVPLDAEARFQAKNFIDTTVYRAGDAGSAWVLLFLRSHGAGIGATAWLALPVALLWTATNPRLEGPAS